MLETAVALAQEAHRGQTRGHGAPYIGHPLAVAQILDDIAMALEHPIDDAARAVAVLHDVIEDCDISEAALGAKVGKDVAARVAALTKPPGKLSPAEESAYFARLNADADDVVRLVKVCDRLHNLSELHLVRDTARVMRAVSNTLVHVLPLAEQARDPKLRHALTSLLLDGVRIAARADNVPVPTRAAIPVRHVPEGVYAIVGADDALPDDAALAHLVAVTRDVIMGGVAMVQLRVKGRGDRSVLAFAQAIVPLCRRHGVPVLVNDRADLARAADADGVHVGADDLPPLFARVVTGPGARVGTSTHTLDELRTAIAAGGADHLGFGPVYASTTKSGHADVTGLDRLAAACAASRLPIVAIGGITSPERCARATRAGASLVATASAFAHPGEARVMARRLSIAFTAARSARMEA